MLCNYVIDYVHFITGITLLFVVKAIVQAIKTAGPFYQVHKLPENNTCVRPVHEGSALHAICSSWPNEGLNTDKYP